MAVLIANSYQDQLLTNLSLRWSNPSFLAERVFPVLPVPKRTGVYFKFDKENLRVPTSALRTGTDRAVRVEHGLTKANYGPLTEKSLEIGIDNDVWQQAQDPFVPLRSATMTVTEKAAIIKEKDLASDLTNTSTITQNVTLSGTSQWSDFNNSDPFADIQTGIDTIKAAAPVVPNTLIMGWQVFSKLMNHPDLLERIKYTQRGQLTPDLIGGLFNLTNVFVGDQIYNSSVQGQTDSLSYIWGKSAILAYINPQPQIESLSLGYHFTLNPGNNVEGVYKGIDRWFEQWNKTNFVRWNDYYDREFVAPECGYLIKNAVA